MTIQINNIVNFLSDSNRWKHLLLGIAYGLMADDTYCALYGGAGVSGALEFKDCHHDNGDKPIKNWSWSCWDWVDFLLTFTGVLAGYGARALVAKHI